VNRLHHALRCEGFPRLLGAYAVNELGDSFGLLALAVLVYDRTGDPLATTALFLVSKFLPALVAPLATARLDRVRIARAGPWIYLAEAVVFAILALLGEQLALGVVLGLALLDGTLALTGRSLVRAATASVLIERDALRAGNSVMNLVFAVAATAGPAAAGLVAAGWGPGVALGLDAVSFLLAGAVLVGARAIPRPDDTTEGWLERFRSGMEYVRARPYLGALVATEAIALVFFTLVTPIEVVYAKHTLSAGDSGFGALMASWGGGIVLGGLVFASTPRLRPRTLIEVSTAIIAVAYLLLAIAPGLLIACAISVLGGLGNGIQWISVMTEVQKLVQTDFQARVIVLLESVAAAAPGIGFVAGGAITAALSPRSAYAIASAGVLSALWLFMRTMRRAEDASVSPPAEADGEVEVHALPGSATVAAEHLALTASDAR
jgi:predicted MFS family arabinose efflux permease